MRTWQSWLALWNHRPHVHMLVSKLAPFANRRMFPILGGCLTLAATITMSLPSVPMICALVSLRPSRWRAIVFWSVLGSAIGAMLLVFAFAELSLPWLDAKMPELMNSSHWKHLSEMVARYGWLVLAGVAALPIPDTPAFVLAAMLGMPLGEVFIAVAIGKSLKYGVVARATQITVDNTDFVNLPVDEVEAGTDRHRR